MSSLDSSYRMLGRSTMLTEMGIDTEGLQTLLQQGEAAAQQQLEYVVGWLRSARDSAAPTSDDSDSLYDQDSPCSSGTEAAHMSATGLQQLLELPVLQVVQHINLPGLVQRIETEPWPGIYWKVRHILGGLLQTLFQPQLQHGGGDRDLATACPSPSMASEAASASSRQLVQLTTAASHYTGHRCDMGCTAECPECVLRQLTHFNSDCQTVDTYRQYQSGNERDWQVMVWRMVSTMDLHSTLQIQAAAVELAAGYLARMRHQARQAHQTVYLAAMATAYGLDLRACLLADHDHRLLLAMLDYMADMHGRDMLVLAWDVAYMHDDMVYRPDLLLDYGVSSEYRVQAITYHHSPHLYQPSADASNELGCNYALYSLVEHVTVYYLRAAHLRVQPVVCVWTIHNGCVAYAWAANMLSHVYALLTLWHRTMPCQTTVQDSLAVPGDGQLLVAELIPMQALRAQRTVTCTVVAPADAVAAAVASSSSSSVQIAASSPCRPPGGTLVQPHSLMGVGHEASLTAPAAADGQPKLSGAVGPPVSSLVLDQMQGMSLRGHGGVAPARSRARLSHGMPSIMLAAPQRQRQPAAAAASPASDSAATTAHDRWLRAKDLRYKQQYRNLYPRR